MYLRKSIAFLFVLNLASGTDIIFNDDQNSNRKVDYYKYTIENVGVFPELPINLLMQNESENSLCKNDTELFITSLKNHTAWAYQMWDSTARTASGHFVGITHNLGHFDECLKVKKPLKAQYCLAMISLQGMETNTTEVFNNDDPYASVYKIIHTGLLKRDTTTLGLCVPKSCTNDNLQASLDSFLNNQYTSDLKSNYSIQVVENTCQDLSFIPFSTSEIIFCSLSSILIVIIISSSILYGYMKKRTSNVQSSSTCIRILLGFSLQKNVKSFLRNTESYPRFETLFGLRYLCICCVILVHTIGVAIAGPVYNTNFIESLYANTFTIFIQHGDLVVDTFFLLSGITVIYTLFEYENKISNPFVIIILRYIRLTPIYAFVIFFYATILYRTGDGPVWPLIMTLEKKSCEESWWTNILYISNYVKADKMCMVHSWYLSCDMHYFIFTVLLFTFLKKQRKTLMIVLVLMLVVSMATTFAIIYIKDYPAVQFFYPKFLQNPRADIYLNDIYIKSHTRMSPYIVGLIGGLVLVFMKNVELKLSTKYSILLFVLGLLIMGAVPLVGTFFYPTLDYYYYNRFVGALYAAIHRPIWSAAIILVIFSFGFGHVPLAKNFLMSRPIVVLSKLTYTLYIIHMPFLFRDTASSRNNFNFTLLGSTFKCLLMILIVTSASFVMYVAVEAPFRNMFKEIFFPSKPQDQSEITQDLSLVSMRNIQPETDVQNRKY